MAWRISFTPQAERDLGRIDPRNARRINCYLRDPGALGGPLKGQLREFWRCRVGDYRISIRLEDEQLLVVVVKIAHGSEVYGGH